MIIFDKKMIELLHNLLEGLGIELILEIYLNNFRNYDSKILDGDFYLKSLILDDIYDLPNNVLNIIYKKTIETIDNLRYEDSELSDFNLVLRNPEEEEEEDI